VTAPLLPTPSQPPSAFLSQHQSWSSGNNYNQNSGIKGCFCGGWKNHKYGYLNHGTNESNSGQNINSNGFGSWQFVGQNLGNKAIVLGVPVNGLIREK
jgi:hypothetical protein